MPTRNSGETTDDFVSRCMSYPDMQKYPSDQRYAICMSKASEAYRHRDFQRIHDEFCKHYTTETGDIEYYSWLKALSLDESKPYGQSRESFKWAKNMIKQLREDAENKYYGVLVGLPLTSMNGNVYRERDLIAAALTLKGKHPSLNHKDEFWFNETNRYGVLTVEDARYEDGAVEAVLRVPKTAVCPICNGAKMTELIDNQHIVNVSLEGNNNGAFEFTDPPFTLLTSDVLPGIPLARIKPLEKIVSEAFSVTKLTGNKNTMVIKAKIKEDSYTNLENPNTTVNTNSLTTALPKIATPVDSDAMIDTQNDLAKTVLGGSVTDNYSMITKPPTTSTPHHTPNPTEAAMQCPDGQEWSEDEGKCVPMQMPSETESAAPQYMGDTNVSKGQAAPTSVDTSVGPQRNKPPERNTPQTGSVPGSVTAQTNLGTAPVGARAVWTGTSPVENLATLESRRAAINAEMKAKSYEEKALKWEEEYAKLNDSYSKALGTIEAFKLQVSQSEERKENAIRDMHNAQVERERYQRIGNDAAGERDEARRNLETIKRDYDNLNTKYNGLLQTNLSLSEKLTKANEEYIEQSKKLTNVTEALERAQIQAKKITRITA